MAESFWMIPDIANVRTPLGILREQAAALTALTKGTLVGIVEANRGGPQDMFIQLDVAVPALNDYRHRILVYDQPVTMYPGLLWVGEGPRQPIYDEQTFISTVKDTLASERIRNVLATLLAQATQA